MKFSLIKYIPELQKLLPLELWMEIIDIQYYNLLYISEQLNLKFPKPDGLNSSAVYTRLLNPTDFKWSILYSIYSPNSIGLLKMVMWFNNKVIYEYDKYKDQYEYHYNNQVEYLYEYKYKYIDIY